MVVSKRIVENKEGWRGPKQRRTDERTGERVTASRLARAGRGHVDLRHAMLSIQATKTRPAAFAVEHTARGMRRTCPRVSRPEEVGHLVSRCLSLVQARTHVEMLKHDCVPPSSSPPLLLRPLARLGIEVNDCRTHCQTLRLRLYLYLISLRRRARSWTIE